MRAFLPNRMSPRFWIGILIAGVLIESWIISRNMFQPGNVEIAAEESGPVEAAAEKANPVDADVEEAEPQKKAAGAAPGPKQELGDEKGRKSESFDMGDKGSLPIGWASWANKGSVVEISPLKAHSAPNALA